MNSFRVALIAIAAVAWLSPVHAVDPAVVPVALPAWSIAAPDFFVPEAGMPDEYAGYRLASATTVKYSVIDGGVGLKRAPRAGGGVSAPRSEGADGAAAAAAPAPQTTDWMLLLCGVVVAGFIARRRTNVETG